MGVAAQEQTMSYKYYPLLVLVCVWLAPGCTSKALDLRNTAITDEQLQYLKEMSQLQVLILDSTGITDAGIEPIKGCSQLQRIFLRNTRVTAAGVQDLKKTFPRADIAN
jgi:hypothetical protein